MLFHSRPGTILWRVWDFYLGSADARTRPTRSLSLLAAALGLVWAAISLWLDIPAGVAAGLLLAVISFSATTIVALGFDRTGRVLWFVGASMVVLIAFFSMPERAYVDQVFAAVVAAVFMNFSFRDEKRLIAFVIAIIIGSWLFGLYLGRDYFGPSGIDEELAATVLAPLITLTTIVGVAANVMVFAVLAERYRERQQQARAEAVAANMAKSAFLASMSHEIRTPMNGVIGITELLAASELTEAQRRNLGMIRKSSHALLRIINDILDMSAIEAGRMSIVAEPMDLAATIEAAVDSLRAYADEHHVMMDLRFHPDLPSVVIGDPDRLTQIVVNVLGNGIKFSRRQPLHPPGQAGLAVDLTATGQIRLVFRDNGIGIAAEFLPHLFNPFHRAEEVTTQRFGGTGLGLAIVSELVTKMHGEISVSSQPGVGTDFTVLLPLKTVKPKEPLQDLTGRRVVLAGLMASQAQFWRGLLQDSGAEIIEVGLGDMPQGVRRAVPSGDADALCILSLFDQTGALVPDRLAGVRAILPDVPVIAHSVVRSQISGQTEQRTYILQSCPTLRSDAVAALKALVRPIGEAAQAEDVRQAGPVPTAKATGSILVAEDNEINQIVLVMQLEKLGHRVDMAANGVEALAKWRAGQFDLVLTDCHMPEMNGYDLARAIRQDEAAKGLDRTPIVAITANVMTEEATLCYDAGMDDVLTKPMAFAALSEAVDRHVAPQHAASAGL